MADTGSTTANESYGHHQSRSCGGRVKKPWSAVEIAIVVGGFILFWPIGLVALAVKLFKGELWAGASEMAPPWKNWNKADGFGFAKSWTAHSSSGNAAFDAYKKSQLERLEAERRKLEDEQKAFGEYLAKLRRARDQEEFDRFLAERHAPAAETPQQ